MEFKKAVEENIDGIAAIIGQAKNHLKKQGVDQWQGNYPNRETVKNDVISGNNYVLVKENDIVATVVISFDREDSYESIYEGKWLSDGESGIIHRVAVDDKYKGLGISSELIGSVEKLCLSKGVHSIKVDTHRQNIPMQKVLEKNKFQYCGLIYLEDKSERIVFEKLI